MCCGRVVTAAGGQFKLQDRAVHVWGEAARVPAFRDACNDGAASAPDKLRRLAQLMDDSHASCRRASPCPLYSSGALESKPSAVVSGCIEILVCEELLSQVRDQHMVCASRVAAERPVLCCDMQNWSANNLLTWCRCDCRL